MHQQRVNSFKILKKIDTLIYRLKLSSVMKIHSMIFITQLKSFSTFDADFYRRSRSNQKNSSSVQMKNDSESENSIKFYEIETLLNKRISTIDRIIYLIKWKDYDFQNNVWYSFHALKNFMNLMQKYDVEHQQSATNNRRRSTIKDRDRFVRRQIAVSSSVSSSSSSFSSLVVIESARKSTRLLFEFATISKKRKLKNESN